MPDDASFALCLTHDVDRPYKTVWHVLARARGDLGYHLRSLLGTRNPYWTFEDVMALERDLGVRSAFYFLDEPHLLRERPPADWLDPAAWVQHLLRYDVTAPEVVDLIRRLDAGGWEVGLHGSYHSSRDRDRLRTELATLEEVLGHEVVGGRQHYLKLAPPETWSHHRAIGLRYDASLGSSRTYGFQDLYRPFAPFADDFLVFPLTLMEVTLARAGPSLADRWTVCEQLLEEAVANRAVMTVLWHPRFFNEDEFPGYRHLYRRLVERALELGAWVGTPAEFCAVLDDDGNAWEPVTAAPPSLEAMLPNACRWSSKD